MSLKLGKRPATEDRRDLRLENYADIDAILRRIAARFGNGLMLGPDGDWGMLGNALAGDCVFAGGGHEEMIDGKVLVGSIPTFTDESALSDYSAVTGYDPGDPATDQGTYVRDAMRYRQQVGLLDAHGERHKIGPYVSIDPKNWDHLIVATWLFGAAGIGFDFPEVAWEQFDAREPWDVTSSDGPSEGGHYVPVVGSMLREEQATCVTWARRQILTREFYEKRNDEAWAYLPGKLRTDGTGFHHLDTVALLADLRAIQG